MDVITAAERMYVEIAAQEKVNKRKAFNRRLKMEANEQKVFTFRKLATAVVLVYKQMLT